MGAGLQAAGCSHFSATEAVSYGLYRHLSWYCSSKSISFPAYFFQRNVRVFEYSISYLIKYSSSCKLLATAQLYPRCRVTAGTRRFVP